MKEKCAAGIVLYNPEISRLKENIDSIIIQVGSLVLFDNGSKNIDEIEKLLNKYINYNIKLIKSYENKGIAYALNSIVNEACTQKYNWLITLDQDSITQNNTIKTFERYTHMDKVAIICPYIIDKRRKNINYNIPNEEITEIDFCITSGSLINVSICKEIGEFDEWMFIGLVDNDYCKRIKIHNYRIIRVNSIILDHELGDLYPSKYEVVYLWLEKKLGISLFGKLSYKREVNAMRLYYATRNIIYMMKKYESRNFRIKSCIFLIKNSLFSIMRGNNKIYLIRSIKKGIIDGCRSKTEIFKDS